MQLDYGIDIGGTKIELIACDATLEVRHRQRIDTPHDYADFVDTIIGLIRGTDALLGQPARAVGIGLPGVVDRATGLQLSANVPALTGRTVGHDLRERLGRPLHFGNDLQCFALSEAHGGAADGQPSMFGAILGTGAGGGYCVEGRLIDGYNGIAGEWGHWSVAAHLLAAHGLPVVDCACGLRGCVERYVSGGGLTMIHRHLGGEGVDAATIIARATQGDATATRALDVHRDLLGHALASLILAVDPHVIVLGGGLSKDERLYRELPAAISAHLFRGVRVPPILPPVFGDAGGARGAALLTRQHRPTS